MAYEKQNFTDGKVLTAAQLNHMEDGIADAVTKEQMEAAIAAQVAVAILPATVE